MPLALTQLFIRISRRKFFITAIRDVGLSSYIYCIIVHCRRQISVNRLTQNVDRHSYLYMYCMLNHMIYCTWISCIEYIMRNWQSAALYVVACIRCNDVVIFLLLLPNLSYIFQMHLLLHRIMNPTQAVTQIQTLVAPDAGYVFRLLLHAQFIRYFLHSGLVPDVYLTI